MRKDLFLLRGLSPEFPEIAPMKAPLVWWIGRGLFTLALVVQLWRTDHYFTYAGSDRNQQLVGTIQTLRGLPFSTPVANPLQLDQTGEKPLQGWPPGYPKVMVMLQRITGDWFLADRWFNALGVLFLLLSAHLLLQQLVRHISPWVYPAFFGFWALSFSPFHYTIGAEEWALAFFLMASWFVLRAAEQGPLWSWRKGLWLAGVWGCIAVGILFRYLYLPLWVMLAFFAWGAYRRTEWTPKQGLLFLIFLAVPSLLLLYALQPSYTLGGHWWDSFAPERWYPEHLWKMDAFPFKAWAYFSIEGLTNKWTGLSVSLLYLFKGGLFLGCLLMFWSFYRGYRREDPNSAWVQLQFAWWGGVLGTVGLLAFQSLARAPEWHDGVYHWTYVQETRYFASLMVMVQILGLVRAFQPGLAAWEKWGWRLLLFLAFAYAGFHSLYRSLSEPQRETRWAETDLWLQDSYRTVARLTAQGEQVVWVYGNALYEEDEAHLAAIAGASMLSRDALLYDPLPHQQPIWLLTSCEAEACAEYLRRNWTLLEETGRRKRLQYRLAAP